LIFTEFSSTLLQMKNLEKRQYTRFYFMDGHLPALTLLAGGKAEIPAEILNISSGGLCLSIDQDSKLTPEQLRTASGKALYLGNGTILEKFALKLCYFFSAENLKKIICGMEFRELESEKREKIAEYVQENAEDEDDIRKGYQGLIL